MNKELIIELDYVIDRFDFCNILSEIYSMYKDVKFEGWLTGYRIVNVEGENYKVIPKFNTIILRLTRNKSVHVPKRGIKPKNFIKYKEFLNGLNENNEGGNLNE